MHFGKGLARTLVPIMIYCACAELCDHVGSCENGQKYASGEQVSLDKMKPLEGVEHGNILPAQLKLESSLEPDKKPFHSGPEIPLWSSHKCPLMCMLLTEEKSSQFKSSMYHTEHLPNVGSSVRADLVCTTPNHARYQQYFPPNSLHSNDRKHMNPDSVNMLVFLPDNLSNYC